jgi:tRNA (guanine-N7-)-methyltransferase
MVESIKYLKRPASFVRRQGRITPGQRMALQDLLPQYALPATGTVDFSAVFGRQAPVVLEIGFGCGDAFVEMAAEHPEWDFVGVEVYDPGVGHCLLKLHQAGLSNIRVVHGDVWPLLSERIARESLSRIQVFFPDPWPKKRHHKRRLLQADFLAIALPCLQTGGLLHVATDWQPYAESVEACFAACPALEACLDDSVQRSSTKFERRGQRLGHSIVDLIHRKIVLA